LALSLLQLFIPPMCRPGRASCLGWTILIIGQDDGLLQLVNRLICFPYRTYTSRKLQIRFKVVLVRLTIGSPGIPEDNIIYVMLHIWKHIYLRSDKDGSPDTCQILARLSILFAPSVKLITSFISHTTKVGSYHDWECSGSNSPEVPWGFLYLGSCRCSPTKLSLASLFGGGSSELYKR
jgi:hypothetical protein